MTTKTKIFVSASALLLASGVSFADPVGLSVHIPGDSLESPPDHLTVVIFDAQDKDRPVANQTFVSGDWKSSASESGVTYQVTFTALDGEMHDGLWYQGETERTVSEGRWVESATVVSPNLNAAGELITGVGVRFPGGALQTDAGITTETDPTVAPWVKDGLSWSEIAAIPAGFADNVDNVGVTTETDPTVLASVKDGVSWGELIGIPGGFADGVDNVGLTAEVDPQVGSNTTHRVPRWNGSALVTGNIYDNNTGDIGIGTTGPNRRLHVEDTTASNNDAAIYGEHDVTSGFGFGVQGVGGKTGVHGSVDSTGSSVYTGVDGDANTSSGSGTTVGIWGSGTGGNSNWGGYGYSNGSGTANYGLSGSATGAATTNYGIYGNASGGTTNWAGYFNGDVNVTSDLDVGNDVDVTGRVTTDELAVTSIVGDFDVLYGTTPFIRTDALNAEFELLDDDGTSVTIELDSDDSGGQVYLRNSDASQTNIFMDGDSGGGGYMYLRNASNTATIILDGDDGSGNGRITTDELNITGGSDLSEHFDIGRPAQVEDVLPGMVVSLDPAAPGSLMVSSEAYDHKVAGIISGADGIRPGLTMGQKGTIADGDHPVALTGRVYCLVDASQGAIEIGDLLTTSSLPGHAMKATDADRRQGAIIGKAMTSLASGQGKVLVLVSLQ